MPTRHQIRWKPHTFAALPIPEIVSQQSIMDMDNHINTIDNAR